VRELKENGFNLLIKYQFIKNFIANYNCDKIYCNCSLMGFFLWGFSGILVDGVTSFSGFLGRDYCLILGRLLGVFQNDIIRKYFSD
jgi:hypothetical protein